MLKRRKGLMRIIRNAIILACCLLAIHSTASAQVKIHEVKPGETLFSIAKTYDISVDQLKQWNDVEEGELKIGQTLAIRDPDSETDSTIIHEVEPRETLFSISKQYDVSIAGIRRWNDLEGNTLEVGQKLIIHPDDLKSTGESLKDTGSGTSLVSNEKETPNTYYTVKAGDTLYDIARKHNMSVEELKALNNLTSNTIRVGQRLTVQSLTSVSAPSIALDDSESSPQGKFIVYRVEEKQEIDSILVEFNMSRSTFNALNPDLERTTFTPGQEITVLAPPTKSYENPYTVSASLKSLGETRVSVYDSSAVGTPTTSGELYNPEQLTAAHSNITLGTILYIQNPVTLKGIYVRINDRVSTNGLKLSKSAYQALEIASTGASTVQIYQDQ